MHYRKLLLLSFSLLLSFLVSPLFAQVAVDVNIDITHSVNGTSQFDRSKFIVLHADLTERDWDSDEQRASFLNDYDVYLGRNNGMIPWEYNQSTPDPARPGFPSAAAIAQRGQVSINNFNGDVAAASLRHRTRGMMIGGQEANFPNGRTTNPNGCCTSADPWVYNGFEAIGEFMGGLVADFFVAENEIGPLRPPFVEVINEPFVKAASLGVTKEEIAEMHNVVARKIRERSPETMVGGYTAAHPAYEAADFNHWRNNWKMFIDVAGEEMDFFSLHLYDIYDDNGSISPATTTYRTGSNAEAILDMVEHYSTIRLGEVRPWVISEYGAFSQTRGTPYSARRDWEDMRSFSSFMMQLMERQDVMAQTVPFLLTKATWWSHASGNRYPHRLLHQKSEEAGQTGDEWVYSANLLWYDFWSTIKGRRVDTRATDPDLQTDAYVDGNKVFVILNNIEFNPVTVRLNTPIPEGQQLESVKLHHLYLDDETPTLDRSDADLGLTEVRVDNEATMIVEYTFTGAVTATDSLVEKKYYANTYFQPINANTSVNFSVNDVTIGAYGEAILRLGVGRDHNRSLTPRVAVNGTEIVVPEDYRGYDQRNRDRFFGVLEIPVPYNLLEATNTVSITFSDGGGHISSLGLQVFGASREIIRSEDPSGVTYLLPTDERISVYPNPISDRLNVTILLELGTVDLTVLSVDGKTVHQAFGLRGASVVRLPGLRPGVYFLRFRTESGQVFSQRVVRG